MSENDGGPVEVRSNAQLGINLERESFEVAAKRMGYDIARAKNGPYVWDDTEQAWKVWQAATEAAIGTADAIRHVLAERDAQAEELLRTWFVLKEFGRHPGRTDDRLSDCVRLALMPNV